MTETVKIETRSDGVEKESTEHKINEVKYSSIKNITETAMRCKESIYLCFPEETSRMVPRCVKSTLLI